MQIHVHHPEVLVPLPICGCGHSGVGAPGVVSRSHLAMGRASTSGGPAWDPARTLRQQRACLRWLPAPQPLPDVFDCFFIKNWWKSLHHMRFLQRKTSKNTAESVLNCISQVGPSRGCFCTCGPKITISLIMSPVEQNRCFGYRGQIIHFFSRRLPHLFSIFNYRNSPIIRFYKYRQCHLIHAEVFLKLKLFLPKIL